MEKRKAMAWVRALRSGKFKQGPGGLRTTPEGREAVRYCCLGVLGKISKLSEEQLSDFALLDSKQAMNQCGLRSSGGEAFDSEGSDTEVVMKVKGQTRKFESLAEANDKGVSFRKIATWIEKNYELL
jgi:hypothetical protein